MSTFIRTLMAMAVAIPTGSTFGQTAYPARTVRVVVPFPPGGTNDLAGRIVMRELADTMGQPFVIDNRAGASGIIGAEIVAKAPPDGHTLMVSSTSHLTNGMMFKKVPYDTLKDFTSVALLAATPGVLMVHPSLPARSVKEFVALAKARPGQISYSSNGEGGTLHLSMSYLGSMANIQMAHVPYKGGTPATTALVSGEVQSLMGAISTNLSFIKAGRVRPLAVSSARRSTALPELPTISEAGVKGFDVDPWVGVFAPAATPRPVIERLHAAIKAALQKSDVRRQLDAQALEVWLLSQEEFAAKTKADYAKWGKIIQLAGVRPE
ncbi:MAG TPA: tripartite tricarboxylate transporter substrate binding protein [Burkholderiales bacterium]|nr:tripartite tricarboxylate transporter substrate binding protein [Burkholderiales bacterium]